jgi:uncharacterized protein
MKKMLLAVLLPLPLAAQTPEQPQIRTITVDAMGTVERAPERARLMLSVESEATTAAEAGRANAEQMDRLIAALRQLGYTGPEVRTIGYDLNPIYGRQDDPRGIASPRITGYRAVNTVQVQIDTIARVGPTIDAALNAGANRVAGVHFELRDPDAARVEALGQAMAKARREAEALAAAAGVTLGPVHSVQTSGGGQYPPPMPMYRSVAMDGAQAPTPIEPGTLTVSAHVVLVYRIVG